MTPLHTIRLTGKALARSLGGALRLVGQGLLSLGHHSLAALGLAVAGLVLVALAQPELRHRAEAQVLDWLQMRQGQRLEVAVPDAWEPDPAAAYRATAIDPADLPRQQASLTQWIARRYKVAPEPIGRLVQEAWALGQRAGIEPTLILAIMAIESSFNPFAQSPMGAQGLMQVMTRIHDEKYSAFGGQHAAFDPVSNLRVGVQVLKECIARMGSVEQGLRAYVGDLNLPEDSGYSQRVLAEQSQMRHALDRGHAAAPLGPAVSLAQR